MPLLRYAARMSSAISIGIRRSRTATSPRSSARRQRVSCFKCAICSFASTASISASISFVFGGNFATKKRLTSFSSSLPRSRRRDVRKILRSVQKFWNAILGRGVPVLVKNSKWPEFTRPELVRAARVPGTPSRSRPLRCRSMFECCSSTKQRIHLRDQCAVILPSLGGGCIIVIRLLNRLRLICACVCRTGSAPILLRCSQC